MTTLPSGRTLTCAEGVGTEGVRILETSFAMRALLRLVRLLRRRAPDT